jgi:uncharacterized protein YqjF (DUF2071 family)
MSQRWCDLLFAHWSVPAEALRPWIPDRLEIDTFEGSAWIAAVPFRMEAVRPRGLPAVPWLSAFPELNVRTYVKFDDKPGVFFFSLDATNPVAVRLARCWFFLPYVRARIACENDGEDVIYRSTRIHPGQPGARFEASYGPTGGVFRSDPGSLDHFLTERYCLYASGRSVDRPSKDLYRAEVHHAPWPLQPAKATITRNSLLDPIGLQDAVAQKAHLLFARELDVRVWPLRKI